MKKYINEEAEEIITRIENADEWDMDDCRRVCELAGMVSEWEEADGETFESVVYAAIDALTEN